ncbi:MAG: hypothetical protein SCH98_09050 [Deferrisomatales bacterium]|nr:hypothetical protein [Deferrisomatales bacterium]
MVRRSVFLVLLTAALTLGPGVSHGGAVWPAPLFLTVEVASSVPDPYFVLSGPIETYRSYPVNGWLREAFEEYGRQKAGGGESRGVLRVRVDELTTRFRAIGSVADLRPERVFKTAVLRMRVSFQVDGSTLVERNLPVASEVSVGWDEVPRAGLYDFEDVLGRVIAQALAETDSVVEEALRDSGRR